MIKKHLVYRSFLVFVFCMQIHAAGLQYYVSPEGDDLNPGTFEKPFATIQKARDELRSIGDDEKRDGVVVYLRGGEYAFDETLVFDMRDSAPKGKNVKYIAYKDEQPVISSLKKVKGWKRLSNPPASLPSKALRQIWIAKVEKGSSFKVLYKNGVMLSRARSEGFSPVRSERGKASLKCLTVPESFDLKKWDNYKDVEVLIRPKYAWAMNILPVDDLNPDLRQVMTTVGGTYPLEPHPKWSIEAHGISETCWFENAVEFLDSPGEWVLDSEKGLLYLWPKDGKKPENIKRPQCVELIRVGGNQQKNKPVDETVKGIVFKGIKFTGSDRYTWKDAEPSFQHDWSAVDQSSAILRFRCASDCIVEDCKFVQAGGTGIRVDLHASGNRIEGNRFSYLGEHGIALCGYGPGTKDVNKHNKVLNNRIDHVGRLYWYGFGIYIAQSGDNIIANNLIHNIPFVGITLSGCRDFNYQRPRNGEGYRSIRWQDISDQNKEMLQNAYKKGEEKTDFFISYLHARDNVIKGNEIFSAVETMGDGNAIYLSGAGTGNIIRKNYIHHVLSSGIQTALRPDDLQKQTTFSKNIIYKCVYGAVEHKHKNHYLNNIFAYIYPTNIYGREWKEWAYFIFGRGPNTGSRIQRNIFYAEDCEPRFYYSRARSPMYDSVIDNNLYYYKNNPALAKRQLEELQVKGHDMHSIVEDPLFKNISDSDFSLNPNSPALDIGFETVDTDTIGLQSPWKKKLVGENLIETTIDPSTAYIEKGKSVQVSIKCSEPAASIHYTLDGSEPTTNSPVYEKSLNLKLPAYVRAKSFKEGAVDLYGAAEFYIKKEKY